MNFYKTLLVLSSAMLISCASTEADKPMVSIENDPRIGEKVNQACFVSSINGWNSVDNDDKAVIVTMIRDQQYKLNLAGVCDVDWAMYRIAIIGKTGSSCVQRGDRIKTDADTLPGSSCRVMSINKWHPEMLDERNDDNVLEVETNSKTEPTQ